MNRVACNFALIYNANVYLTKSPVPRYYFLIKNINLLPETGARVNLIVIIDIIYSFHYLLRETN